MIVNLLILMSIKKVLRLLCRMSYIICGDYSENRIDYTSDDDYWNYCLIGQDIVRLSYK